MALGFLSRRESRKDLWLRLITLPTLHYVDLLSSTCCKLEVARSVVFNRISYPPLILAFCSSAHRYDPLHIYPCICSVAPCLRVLWMSTHGCFSPSFPFFYTGLSQPDAGAQELEIPRTILHGVRLRGVVRRS